MNNITDIPKYVRYDFFMALFGIITAYFLFANERVYENRTLRIIFAIISGACLLYGLIEMKENYEQEKQLIAVERELRRKAALAELHSVKS